VCIPDPALGHCMRPYHDGNGYDARSHIQPASMRDVNHGAMNGSALDTRHNCTRFAGSGDCRRQPSAWTLPSRLFMVSAWAATSRPVRPDELRSDVEQAHNIWTQRSHRPYAWTDITYLPHKHDVGWFRTVAQTTSCPM
jgi:hypothetical protein